MALPSFSVTCNYTGTPTFNQSAPPLPGALVWQEAVATGTASTNTVPGANAQQGPCVLTVYAAADSWFSYGANPDSNASPRVPVPATTLLYFIAAPGDKFMWQAA